MLHAGALCGAMLLTITMTKYDIVKKCAMLLPSIGKLCHIDWLL